ncbi:MAG: ligand-binding SRPBCC domain-containing protein [Saprospiraceae bacterium]|jgi:ligand-binding SRPBCC domain-containing protein
MNLKFKASVKGNYKKVMASFDRNLFEALKPPFGKMEIVEFTGSKKGDRVHIKFHTPIKADWVSNIVEDEVTNEMASFVDVGVELPWPLVTWTHRHIVEKIDDDNSMIIDDITFTASNFILSLIMYPAIFLGFYPRKKIYQDYFEKLV